MLRISKFAAIDLTSTITSRDLDVNLLYLYSFQTNNRTQRQFVQADNAGINSRQYAFSSYIQNISLDPTPMFYPDDNITFGFHESAKLQTVLGLSTLPVMQYRTVDLFFGAGFGYQTVNSGTTIRCFVRLNNGKEVTLAAIYDKPQTSQIVASTQKLFESQIFNTKLSFEIPDIDYILNSTAAEIVALKTILFGSETPTILYFEYSNLSTENIDTITVKGYPYTQLNMSVVNSASLDSSANTDNTTIAVLEINSTNRMIISKLVNASYDVETYMNKFKQSNETYTVTHSFTTQSYNSSNALISTSQLVSYKTVDIFDQIEYIPIVDDLTDHFVVYSVVSIRNDQTGITFSKPSQLVISNPAVIDNFKIELPKFQINATVDKIYNKIERTVNQIVVPSDAPDVLQITKPVFIQVETVADTLTLLPAAFTARIIVNVDISSVKSTSLKIDNLIVPCNAGDLTSFSLPSKTYATTATNFYVLNEFGEVITSGKIIKKT